MSNYQLKMIVENEPLLDADTFQVKHNIHFKLSVLSDAQHDGRSWSESIIKHANSRLVDQIMYELKREISVFVDNVNPYCIHGE